MDAVCASAGSGVHIVSTLPSETSENKFPIWLVFTNLREGVGPFECIIYYLRSAFVKIGP